jgi:uncharacterized protein YkwD
MLSDADLQRYDLNKDGKVNSADALFVLRFVAGLIRIDGTPIIPVPLPDISPTKNTDRITIEPPSGPLQFTNVFEAGVRILNTFDSFQLDVNYNDVKWTTSNPEVISITRMYKFDIAANMQSWMTFHGPDIWGIGVNSSNVVGTSTITATRPSGESVSIVITVENRRSSEFNPAAFPNLVEAPVPAVPEYNPHPHSFISSEYLEYHRMVQERIVWEMLNEARVLDGTHPLSWDTALASAARSHAIDLNVNDMTGHIGSDGSRPSNRAMREGFTGCSVTIQENAGTNYTASTIVRGWLDSPLHAVALLSLTSEVVGIGVDGNKIVAVFGRLSS